MPMTGVEHDPTTLPARSVVLSLLLGSHPDPMSPGALIRAGAYFGISASTVRAALSRAVSAGDLRRADGGYALGPRLVERQRRQGEGIDDAETRWDGSWEMAVIVVTGRPGGDRASLREALSAHRLAELREGVWTRPANLRRSVEYAADPVLTTFRAVPDEDPAELAAGLWDLAGWSTRGCALRDLLTTTTEPAARLAVAAHVVRHLTADPLLPGPLLPREWPAADLRRVYAAYQAELRALTRDQ
ncbi:PaaX family transcriptional regulator C-terminal domain-containing protein [Solicola gregarius]|uniref:PaaX domain-containing protein, C- domain protein n=1 Tax=Solicola gregarius TaxID=2908642 RepID=A0AA46YPB4_9ACTN|nr:PaaX family transcriptional regulator C-terminal domain-containing protein [Solicola gregarius]UYM07438.1 PaaX domain-containing protein, C- domain protein [Solicola gregarius]